MKIKELAYDDRPREKLLEKGPASLSNSELIAILLRTGSGKHNAIETAQMLLKSAGDVLSGVANMDIPQICSISGIGPGKGVCIAAAFELGKRYAKEENPIDKTPIRGADMIYRLMIPEMKGLKHEECWAFLLNRANYIILKKKLSSGGLDATVIDIKHLIKLALEHLASGIILVHNHPSGNPVPGRQDISETASIKKAAETFSISLIDHIIIADDRYYSFADETVYTG